VFIPPERTPIGRTENYEISSLNSCVQSQYFFNWNRLLATWLKSIVTLLKTLNISKRINFFRKTMSPVIFILYSAAIYNYYLANSTYHSNMPVFFFCFEKYHRNFNRNYLIVSLVPWQIIGLFSPLSVYVFFPNENNWPEIMIIFLAGNKFLSDIFSQMFSVGKNA